MKNKEILDSLSAAVKRRTPEMLEDILRGCEQLDLEVRTGGNIMTETTPNEILAEDAGRVAKRPWLRWVAAAAALALAVGTWSAYRLLYAVDSVVALDVNPGIELKVNQSERVLAATALNTEAEIILEDMDLKNVDINVAVNAVVGSMLKNGYISEAKNSILISVEHVDAAKGEALQKKLSDEVGSLLSAYSVGGAVLSQTVPDDERLAALASEYGISLGKAALADLLVSQDPRLQFADIAALPVNDINLLLTGRQSDMGAVASAGQASSGEYIGEETAKSVALAHAGVTEDATSYIRTKLDYEDGRMVYDVDFFANGIEYEYEIDALNGEIYEYDYDAERHPAASGGSENNAGNSSGGSSESGLAPAESDLIGEAAAEEIALAHAGLSASAVSRLRSELDRDDGRTVYDVEFRQDRVEYEYEVDAATGQILEWDADYD